MQKYVVEYQPKVFRKFNCIFIGIQRLKEIYFITLGYEEVTYSRGTQLVNTRRSFEIYLYRWLGSF